MTTCSEPKKGPVEEKNGGNPKRIPRKYDHRWGPARLHKLLFGEIIKLQIDPRMALEDGGTPRGDGGDVGGAVVFTMCKPDWYQG